MKFLTGMLLALMLWTQTADSQVTTATAARLRSGTTLPATCRQGDVYFVTGTNTFYVCGPANSWVVAGSGTSGGGSSQGTAGTFLVQGGQVVWTSAYTFRVSAASYYIAGTAHTSTEQTITLTAAAMALDRIDVIAVDDTGTVVKVTGTAAAQPSEPDVDPSTQLKLSIVYVSAGSTSPSATNTTIYLENAGSGGGEYDCSTSGSGFNANSTNNPRTGSKDIEGTTVAAAAYVSCQKGAGSVDPTTLSQLVFYIRSKAAWANKRTLQISLRSTGILEGKALTLNDGAWGFTSSNTSAYQQIAIPIAQFAIPSGATINQLRIADAGGSIGFYIDDVVFQNGGNLSPGGGTNVPSVVQGDVLYGSATNVLSSLAKSASATRYLSNTGTTNNPAWAQVNLANGATGTLPATNGGTGLATYAQGDLIYGSASNTLSALGKDTNATRYLSNTGTTNNPAWAQINLANGVTGSLPVGNIADGTITYAKVQNVTASKLLGRGDSGVGAPQEITVGTGLTISGTTISASVTSTPALVLISENLLGSDTASVTFSSIPGTYRHLKLEIYGRTTEAVTGSNVLIQLNGDTGANYDSTYVLGNNNAASSGVSLAQVSAIIGFIPGASAARATEAGMVDITFTHYAGTTFEKVATATTGLSSNTGAGAVYAATTWMGWRSAAAITSIKLIPTGGNFKSGTLFSLYGMQ